jgi:hypothetical protein
MSGELAALDSPLVGLSSLAPGSDQLFAGLVLKGGGSIEVIVPFPEYRETLAEGRPREDYDRLFGQASRVRVLANAGSEERAYLQAGETIVHESDLLLAVWDGEPARGIGGTGDVVQHALSLRRPVIVLNPIARTVAHHSR